MPIREVIRARNGGRAATSSSVNFFAGRLPPLFPAPLPPPNRPPPPGMPFPGRPLPEDEIGEGVEIGRAIRGEREIGRAIRGAFEPPPSGRGPGPPIIVRPHPGLGFEPFPIGPPGPRDAPRSPVPPPVDPHDPRLGPPDYTLEVAGLIFGGVIVVRVGGRVIRAIGGRGSGPSPGPPSGPPPSPPSGPPSGPGTVPQPIPIYRRPDPVYRPELPPWDWRRLYPRDVVFPLPRPPLPPPPPARPNSVRFSRDDDFTEDPTDTFASSGGAYGSPSNQPGGT